MISVDKIKLIIWDLDETFWHGILSEGKITADKRNIEILRLSTDCGVINSICSKNDLSQTQEQLKLLEVDNYFVFTSIDWTNKGPRVKNIIDDMHLRYQNVLFIDDNPTNRGEVGNFCDGIMVEDVDVLPLLYDYFLSKKKTDLQHARLKQYKVLEEKRNARQNVDNNEDFLRLSNIKVNIKYDCLNQIDRIEDLVQRSNQLNFTKIRSSKNELLDLFSDSQYKCGYVEVSDRFGDYGIVGFFAIKDNQAFHFVFSCRILGMGVEQYVYNELNRPKLIINGDVVSDLDNNFNKWINQNESKEKGEKIILNHKIVVHGPCDVSQMFGYIKDSPNIVKEFGYVNKNGIMIDSVICTTHAVEYLTFADSIRDSDSIKRLPFYDEGMYKTSIYDEGNDFVIFSLFIDPTLACYKEKKTGLIVCFSRGSVDLTDKNMKNEYINSSELLGNCCFTIEDLDYIGDNFEYLGRIQPNEIVNNIDFIYSHLSKGCKLILTLQSETEFLNSSSKYLAENLMSRSYDNTPRHFYNKQLNDLLREWGRGKDNLYFLDFNKYITGQESFTDHISHFKREVYYKMSKDLVKIIKHDGNITLKNNTNSLSLLLASFSTKIKRTLRKIVRHLK